MLALMLYLTLTIVTVEQIEHHFVASMLGLTREVRGNVRLRIQRACYWVALRIRVPCFWLTCPMQSQNFAGKVRVERSDGSDGA